jgi:hypothetical protein
MGEDMTTLRPDIDAAGLAGVSRLADGHSKGFIRQYAVWRAENDFGNPSLTTEGQN